jgi:hypothetical protein
MCWLKPAFACRWLADVKPIAGATRTSVTPTRDQVGKRVSAEVTATRPGHETAVRISFPTGPAHR